MRLINDPTPSNNDRLAVLGLALAVIALVAVFDLANRNTQLRQQLDNHCQPQRPGQILDSSVISKTTNPQQLRSKL